LPPTLPGDFFLLEWDRDRGVFIIHVDDEDHSTYRLASKVSDAMLRFRMWGIADIGNRAIDIAAEFGVAQAMLKDGRVFAEMERGTPRRVLVKFEEHDDGRHARSSLRPDF